MFLVNTLGTKESQKTLNNIYSRLVVVILHTGDKKEKSKSNTMEENNL